MEPGGDQDLENQTIQASERKRYEANQRTRWQTKNEKIGPNKKGVGRQRTKKAQGDHGKTKNDLRKDKDGLHTRETLPTDVRAINSR